MEKPPLLILLLAGLLIAALFLSRLSDRLKMPDILWFMLLGLLLGPTGFGVVSGYQGIEGNETLLLGAVALILYEAGVRTRIGRVRRHAVSIGLLVTVGLLVTALLLGVAGKGLFGMTLSQGLLLGAILSTTDPASILPILRRLSLPESVTETLVAESALGDVTGSLLTMLILSFSMPSSGFGGILLSFFGSVLWGGILGLGTGFLVRILVTHERLGIFRDNVPVLMISALLAVFAFSQLLHGQTLLAAYLFGTMVGRMADPGVESARPGEPGTGPSLKTLNDLLAYLASFLVFFVLGTLIPGSTGGVSVISLALFLLFLVLVVRPVVVFSLVPFDRVSRFSVPEMAFMSVVRETGIMAGALLGLAHDHLPSSAPLTVVTVVVGTILIGAVGSAPVARKLGFVAPSAGEPLGSKKSGGEK